MPVPLICQSTIVISIANHYSSPSQSGPDFFSHQLRPRHQIPQSLALGCIAVFLISCNTFRTCSPIFVPPGSNVCITSYPNPPKYWTNNFDCVLLPEPSGPSKVIK